MCWERGDGGSYPVPVTEAANPGWVRVESFEEGLDVGDLVVEAGLMSAEEVSKQLSPARLSGLEAVTAAIPIIVAAEDL